MEACEWSGTLQLCKRMFRENRIISHFFTFFAQIVYKISEKHVIRWGKAFALNFALYPEVMLLLSDKNPIKKEKLLSVNPYIFIKFILFFR